MVRSSYWLIYWLIDWKAVAPFNATSQLGEAYRVSQPAPGNSLLSDRQLGMLDEVVREKDEFIARFVHLFIRKCLSWLNLLKTYEYIGCCAERNLFFIAGVWRRCRRPQTSRLHLNLLPHWFQWKCLLRCYARPRQTMPVSELKYRYTLFWLLSIICSKCSSVDCFLMIGKCYSYQLLLKVHWYYSQIGGRSKLCWR